MHIALICLDTRGGIQPYVALGKGFLAAGHKVTVLAPGSFGAFIWAQGMKFVPLTGDPKELLLDARHAGVAEKGFTATHTLLVTMIRKNIPEWGETILSECAGCDLLVGSVLGSLIGPTVAERLGIPFIQAHVQPWTPSGALQPMIAPGLMSVAPGWVRRMGHEAFRQLFWLPVKDAVRDLRRKLLLDPDPGLAPLGRAAPGQPMLYGFSEVLIPRPPDWPKDAEVTGYWFLDLAQGWTPPEALARFLDDGPPPICVGFGSMSSADAAATTRLVLEAVEGAGVRAILLAGWGGLKTESMPEGVIALDSAPHDWLLPKCSVSVHHGGAGTTGASLRAGIPSVIVPFTADQPFWARCVVKRGLGLAAPPRRALTSTALRQQISSALGDEGLRERARLGGIAIRGENGVGRAVGRIEKFMRSR